MNPLSFIDNLLKSFFINLLCYSGSVSARGSGVVKLFRDFDYACIHVDTSDNVFAIEIVVFAINCSIVSVPFD